MFWKWNRGVGNSGGYLEELNIREGKWFMELVEWIFLFWCRIEIVLFIRLKRTRRFIEVLVKFWVKDDVEFVSSIWESPCVGNEYFHVCTMVITVIIVSGVIRLVSFHNKSKTDTVEAGQLTDQSREINGPDSADVALEELIRRLTLGCVILLKFIEPSNGIAQSFSCSANTSVSFDELWTGERSLARSGNNAISFVHSGGCNN